MASYFSRRWTTDPEYIDLLNYIIERVENVESPMNIQSIAREFKEKSVYSQTEKCLQHRIRRVRKIIHSFEHIDTKTKVKMMFALSALINPDFLKELREEALVHVDEKQRIVHYKSNDGSLELRGDHSNSAKNKTAQFEKKRSLRSWIIDYFEKKNNANTIQMNEKDKEMGNLIEFITEKCENVNSPLNVTQVVKDFIQHFGMAVQLSNIFNRVKTYSREIQTLEFLDTPSKVKQLFGLSETLNLEFLKELRKDALVDVDEKNRIVHYQANDGSLELKGDHNVSVKIITAHFESKLSHRSLIIDYFKNKDDADAVPRNEVEKEIWNLIEFITEKSEHFNTPLNIQKLAKDFKKQFGVERSLDCIYHRIKAYRREIQNVELSDTHSKVRQLFALSVILDSNYLKELRKDAVVEVDDLNRITKYVANDGLLTLNGDHSHSAKNKRGWIERKKKQNAVEKYCNFGDDDDADESEKEDGYSEDSDEYPSEEFESEFHSDDDNDRLDQTEDLTEPSKETSDLDIEIRARNRSEMSNHNIFDLNARTKRSYRSEEIETREFIEEENYSKVNKNAVIKTRSGRLSKRRHLDSNFSYDLANSSSSGALMSSSSKDDGRKRTKRTNYTPESSSSNWTGESSKNSMKPNEPDDYDKNYSIDKQVKLEPFRGSIQEDFDEFEEDEDIQQIPKPLQAHDEHNQIEEVPIKIEVEELKIVENPTEDVKPEIAQGHDEHKEIIEVPIKTELEEPVEVKPETSHNSKIKFFKSMQSLILYLETPSLSWIQSKIHRKIQKLGRSDEVILNSEIALTIDLLISRMTNYSVVNLSENVESVNVSNFLCYLKVAIWNSKLIGVEGLVKNINGLIEESQNKRIPMENVSNALRATLDIDGF